MIVAYAFDLPESKVRVRNPPYLGGGFGVRIGTSGKAELLAAALSMKALRPVKIVYSREEDFIASDTRHGGYMHARLGAKKDGTFVALDTTAKLNTGAYAPSVWNCWLSAVSRNSWYLSYSLPAL